MVLRSACYSSLLLSKFIRQTTRETLRDISLSGIARRIISIDIEASFGLINLLFRAWKVHLSRQKRLGLLMCITTSIRVKLSVIVAVTGEECRCSLRAVVSLRAGPAGRTKVLSARVIMFPGEPAAHCRSVDALSDVVSRRGWLGWVFIIRTCCM